MNESIGRSNYKEATISAELELSLSHIRWPDNITVSLPLENRYNLYIKRFIDVSLSVILVIAILSWLIPVLAILIKLDSRGPVFFTQKRNRNGGKLFTCIKLRTMVVNNEADTTMARENDNRITRIGKILRKHHLDEMPQLINVLLGHMSLIGPRPYMVIENLSYEKHFEIYSFRHNVKPGITGLAQSYGYFGTMENLIEVKERVDLDIHYIREWSLMMDAKILYRTLLMAIGYKSNTRRIKQRFTEVEYSS